MFDEWLEELENTVYVYFSDDLDSLVSYYGINLDYYYDNDYSVMDVISEIQRLIEDEEFDDE
jgi:hypothetical protein